MVRTHLLDALKARLDQVEAAQDPALVLAPEALDEAHHLASTLRDDDGDLETRLVLGWFHWYRYLALPEDQDRAARREAVHFLTPCFLGGLPEFPEPLLPVLADNAADTAVTVLQQAMNSDELALMTAAVWMWQRILAATHNDHPDRGMYLSNLGLALLARSERTGAAGDLDEAITTGRAAVAATPTDHPHQA